MAVSENETQCWMCGSPADSAEHKFKKADLVRAHGKGPYKGDRALALVVAGSQKLIRGSNSNALKYAKNLCSNCNNARSQPWDRAYDQLIDWVFGNEAEVLSKRFIDFSSVFGADFEDSQRNVYKYYAKSFGCRLVDAGHSVPVDVLQLFDLEHFQTALRITFSVNEDVLILPKESRDGFIGQSDLYAWLERTRPEQVNGYQSNEHVSWFTAHFWYGVNHDGACGSSWLADKQLVYLGSTKPLTPEQREEAKSRAAATWQAPSLDNFFAEAGVNCPR
ncbi:hypothetical protein KJY73_18020 [Bowmanella sp. Y26]|uniref:hypothetical protein n=1 Tax=Bowmanella yangjiangensis TaxID=2811230 RepID=UPI001BDCF660|nr:hypothetical protein [Bowmanella yangjiangensis]MBT1065489.1 hypothetical protein [Bowmanella yangjiangensis]